MAISDLSGKVALFQAKRALDDCIQQYAFACYNIQAAHDALVNCDGYAENVSADESALYDGFKEVAKNAVVSADAIPKLAEMLPNVAGRMSLEKAGPDIIPDVPVEIPAQPVSA